MDLLGHNILSKVEGVAAITLIGKAITADDDNLSYYQGFVRFNTSDILVKSHIIYFKSCDGIEVDTLFGQLSSVSSPYVVMSFTYGRGLQTFSKHSFLAVPPFSCSLVQYIDASSKETVKNKRFIEEFIGVIRNVVHGILTLQGRGFYCPYLKAKDILIFAGTVKTAQIWNFCFAGDGDGDMKSQDWSKLGDIIRKAAQNQLVSTAEIRDLLDKLRNKSLEGLHILKHSALLTVREKFENILALNMYISVHSKDQFQSASSTPGKSQAITELKNFIATNVDWQQKTPQWMTSRKGYKAKHKVTGASFVERLRDMIEHECDYIPEKKVNPTMTEIQLHGRDPDLESEVRQAWEEAFLQAQNMVAKLDIHY